MTTAALQRRPAPSGVVVPSDPITLGNVLARSGYFADSRDAAQAAVKVMAGQELGFGPVASMTGVYIVKGRVTLSANLMAAAIQRSQYAFRVREHSDEACVIEFFGPRIDEPGMESIGTSSFTMDDAKKAGLAGSETYKKFPRNMLYARALSNGAKWYCPDVFGGGPAYTPDELTDQVTYDGDGQVVSVVEDARPVAAPIDPEEESRREMIADAKAAIEAGVVTKERLHELLTAGGATDLATVGAAFGSMPPERARELHNMLLDGLAEQDTQPAEGEIVAPEVT